MSILENLPSQHLCRKWSPLLCLLIFVFVGCKKPQAFQFKRLDNFSVSEISGDSATLAADVVFYNPNAFKMQVKNIDADFFANDNLIAHHTIDSLINVPSKQDTYVPVKLRISIQPLINNAISALLNKSINFKIKGKTKVGTSGIYTTLPFEFSKDQKINLF